LLTRNRLFVVYAIRGNRGVDINRRNARALADLCALYDVGPPLVTSADDAVGETDRASAEEIDATRTAFEQRGQALEWYDTLQEAVAEAARLSNRGDSILLAGAQGMNQGASLLRSVLG
jgi:UDP-N-acetylmuramoyl-L-alanyl-D-glutamate--2,6-diaminopimelate ligase